MIGHLVLLDAVLRGKRAILLEPLRALAQEQADDLTDLLSELVPETFPRAPRVRLSTGDYRIEGELPAAAPPDEGEIIVATPERLDAILRNPAHAGWASTIGALVVDEAHLIADPRRGPTLELVVASMLSMPAPPRIALLSATVGEPERLSDWLEPCQLIISRARTPLIKQVWQLEDGDVPDAVLAAELRSILAEPGTAAIVFVYRRDGTVALAKTLSSAIGIPVLPYHSAMSVAQRAQTRTSYRTGECRCLVATTALAMGVNLPATHVFVRDTTFFGHGRLRVEELLQILGRAGRGDRSGRGIVLLKAGDDWDAEQLARELRDERLPPLRSSFESRFPQGRSGSSDHEDRAEAAAGLVATCLVRAGTDGLTELELSALLCNTLGARALVSHIDASLRWLIDPSRVIAFRDDQARFHLTVLGQAGVRSMLPLDHIGGLGQLARDLIMLDVEGKLLGRWSPLDHLFIVSLLSERTPKVRRFSEELASQVDGWSESRPTDEKALLFGEWVVGSAGASKVDELFGSLGIRSSSADANTPRKKAYVAMLAAIILDERSRGVTIADIERRWGVTGLDGIEEAWRDTALWLLSGQVALFEVRAFFHHLREHCSATNEQVRGVKHALGRMRSQGYELLERLRYCSPLGPLMIGLRGSRGRNAEPAPSVRTIRKLEEAGLHTMLQVAQLSVNELVGKGVQRRFARQIRSYIKRRLR